jgi:uncharacterized membrane protein
MERQVRRHFASSLVHRVLIGWTCVAFLSALALSAVPRWHELIHSDANTPQHECAVTLISSGNYHKPAPAPLVAVPAPVFHFCFVPAQHPVWVASSFVSARIFEHAPPAIA